LLECRFGGLRYSPSGGEALLDGVSGARPWMVIATAANVKG
jgi:hypothetical protein